MSNTEQLFGGIEHPPTYEKDTNFEKVAEELNSLSSNMQLKTGVVFERPFVCQVSSETSLDSSVADLRELDLGASILLKKNMNYQTVGHELAHLLLDKQFDSIPDKRIANSLKEGINDLASYDTLSSNRSSFEQVVRNINGGEGPQTPFLDDKTSQIFIQSDSDEEHVRYYDDENIPTCIDHVVGRNFTIGVIQKREDVKLNALINCLINHPPSREQMIHPSLYIQTLDNFAVSYKEQKPINPVSVSFTDKVQRVI
jgi:hypothetical protein